MHSKKWVLRADPSFCKKDVQGTRALTYIIIIMLVLQTSKISLHEVLLFIMTGLLLVRSLWKWQKTFLVILLLEGGILLLLAAILLNGQLNVTIALLVFAVREALLILSVIYGTLRRSGGVYSTITSS